MITQQQILVSLFNSLCPERKKKQVTQNDSLLQLRKRESKLRKMPLCICSNQMLITGTSVNYNLKTCISVIVMGLQILQSKLFQNILQPMNTSYESFLQMMKRHMFMNSLLVLWNDNTMVIKRKIHCDRKPSMQRIRLQVLPSRMPGTTLATMSCIVLSNL